MKAYKFHGYFAVSHLRCRRWNFHSRTWIVLKYKQLCLTLMNMNRQYQTLLLKIMFFHHKNISFIYTFRAP